MTGRITSALRSFPSTANCQKRILPAWKTARGKMSKSLGNFFTLRDLVLKGHKPSSIRFLLASVPYRNQLNFTFDGLRQAASNVEKLRNFKLRLTSGNFQPGSTETMTALAEETS